MLLVFWAAALWGCSLVDEDMTVCEGEYQLDYSLTLVTDITTEIETELSQETDKNVADALKKYLSGIFTDRAHDVDLSFYNVGEDSRRLHHEQHIMDATQSSYTLYIPRRRYMHLALANLEGNGRVALEGDDVCTDARLVQSVGDTLEPHRTGVFSARLPMDMKESAHQQFEVKLYMSNSSEALVLDTLDSKVKNVEVVAAGFATDFSLADSTYRFRYTPLFKADKVEAGTVPGTKLCYASVNFPTRNAPSTKTDPAPVWVIRVNATLPSGSITQTQLSFYQPVPAGRFKMVQAKFLPDGSVVPKDSSVGVNVQLDWTPGSDFDIAL